MHSIIGAIIGGIVKICNGLAKALYSISSSSKK